MSLVSYLCCNEVATEAATLMSACLPYKPRNVLVVDFVGNANPHIPHRQTTTLVVFFLTLLSCVYRL